jgi:hypothetical protein
MTASCQLVFSLTGHSELKHTEDNNTRYGDGLESRNELVARSSRQVAVDVMEGIKCRNSKKNKLVLIGES